MQLEVKIEFGAHQTLVTPVELRPPAEVGSQRCVFFIGQIVDGKGQIPALTARGIGHLAVDDAVGGFLIEVINIVEEFARVVIDCKPVEVAA